MLGKKLKQMLTAAGFNQIEISEALGIAREFDIVFIDKNDEERI